MRRTVFSIAALLLWGQQAVAESHYVLVDNSGSMTSFRESVDEEIRRMIAGDLSGADVSVTYFQGDSDTDCEGAVSIIPPRSADESFVLDPPSANGSTLIARAIDALRQDVPDEEASITLYTDGSYSDSVCETPEEICASLAKLRSERPLLDFEFAYPPAIRAAGRAVLSCAGELRASDATLPVIEESAGADWKVPTWPAVVAWSAIPWIFVLLLALNTVSRRRYTKDIEQSNEIDNPRNTATKTEKWAYRAMFAGLVVCTLCLLAFSIVGPTTWNAFSLVYQEANRPLLAIIFAWALTVVTGWYFVERLNDTQARQEKQWRINHASVLERAEAREVSRIRGTLASRYAEQQDRDWPVILRVQEGLSDEDRDRLSNLASHVDSIRARLSELIGEVQSFAVLDRYESASYGNPRSIVGLLIAAEKLDAEIEDDVTSLLDNWGRLLRRLPRIDESLEREILSFDIARLGAAGAEDDAGDA